MLAWGLVVSLILSVLSLLAIVGRMLEPPGTPVPFASMPPEALVVNCAILLLPVAAFGLVLLGLSRMRRASPEVARRLTWRLGAIVFSPVSAFGMFGAAFVASLALTVVGGSVGLLGLVAFSASLSLAVWFFLCAAATALAVPTTRGERSVLWIVVIESFFFACLVAGAQAAATLLNASALLADSTAEVPPFIPWVELPGAIGIAVALAALVAIAFRASGRLRSSALPAAAPVS